MSITQQSSQFQRVLPTGLIGLLGLIVGAITVEYLLNHPDPTLLWRIELAVVSIVSVGAVVVAYRLKESYYTARDLWAIFAWSLIGLIAATGLAWGVYTHIATGPGSVAEPMFIFEELALAGFAFGLVFGLNRRSLLERQMESALDTHDPVESDGVLTVMSLIGDETTELKQRWVVLESLVETTTLEVPIEAFVTDLSNTAHFPDEKDATREILQNQHFPVLQENNLVRINNDIQTVEYIGPQAVVDYLTTSREH